MFKLVGLNGVAGSGKDTIADRMGGLYGYKKLSFAGHLKDIAALSFGLDRDKLDDQEYKKMFVPRHNKTVREILQILGTECFRNNFSDSFWTDHVEYQIDDYMECRPNGLIIISDVRFDNESGMIIRRGGCVVNIDREHANELGTSHTSEKGIDPTHIHCTINNNYTHDFLYKEIEFMVSKWK